MAKCEDGGIWDTNLQCELPVLVVAGGSARDFINTVEVRSLVLVTVLFICHLCVGGICASKCPMF